MRREDPQLLPICQNCGRYKGVGPCRNPACSGYVQISHRTGSQSCTICGKERKVTCIQCGRSYCREHSTGVELHRLGIFDQRVGTCIECNQIVCEKCWILNPNGDIICLAHLEEKRITRGFH